MKRIAYIVLAVIMIFSLFSCGTANEQKQSSEPVRIKIDVKDFGVMTLELYPDVAPITVENFLSYVDEGYYDGLTFHRVMKNFMIQGGDGHGGEHAAIKGEFSSNGVKNDLSHTYGVISMARTTVKDSATSQFFICNATNAKTLNLDGNYAAFGKLIAGSDVLDAISDVEVTYNEWGEKSAPVDEIIINSITRAD
ncbi:MAG: peptidylprolyl isomerase [Clostridia bacterium]|nr:peptidylprolyl isomerase [Clostridia bacterium]